MRQPLTALLNELRTRTQLPAPETLYLLSNLETAEVAQVRAMWADIPLELRRDLISSLAEIAEADFEVNFGAVFRVGLDDEDAQVRARSIGGLWEDEDVRLVQPLTDRLADDESTMVRAAAATSLGRFVLLGELGKIRSRPHKQAYNALLAVCQEEENADIWRRALESLAYAENEIVIELIRQAYASPEEKVRVSAVFAMGRSADTRWALQVKQELFSPNPELRYEAARACGELQLSDTVGELDELTEDVDIEVQQAALWALGQIGGDEARKILERHCQDESESMKTPAEAALNQLEFLHGDLSDLFDRLLNEHER